MRHITDLESALAEIARLRQTLVHIVNCFPEMPSVALQTAVMALAEEDEHDR